MSSVLIDRPTLYTRRDGEGLAIRYLAALKRAPLDFKIVESLPIELLPFNRTRLLPFYIDKTVALHGYALQAYMEERYPAPSLLPDEPVPRAQVRVLAEIVHSHTQDLDADLYEHASEFVDELERCTSRDDKFIIGDSMSMVDVAVVPFLWTAKAKGCWKNYETSRLRRYYDVLSNGRSFLNALLVRTDADAEAA